MKLKRIISLLLTTVMVAGVFSITATAEEKTKISISNSSFYEVVKDETHMVVPIYASDAIDMQCFDITVTYDKAVLELVPEESYIVLPEGEYSYATTNSTIEGTVRFAGMTVEESAKTAQGKIGQIVFTSVKRISKDDVKSELGLSVAELGFGTEVADLEIVPTAEITMNKSANPNPSEEPSTRERGDVDGNDKVDAGDALSVLKHAAKVAVITDTDSLEAADANKDTKVDAKDALLILQVVAKVADRLGNI